jgi:chemotaxis-related protein WspB
MLALVFQLGSDRIALPAEAIEEIVAMVNLRPLPKAPSGIVGDFNYHGRLVPVIDLSELDLGRVSVPRWSTRIILTRRPDDTTLIGLIAEHATELVPIKAEAETTPSFADQNGTVKWFDWSSLSEGFLGGYLNEHESAIPEDYAMPLQIAENSQTGSAATPLPEPASSSAPAPAVRKTRRRAPRLNYLPTK